MIGARSLPRPARGLVALLTAAALLAATATAARAQVVTGPTLRPTLAGTETVIWIAVLRDTPARLSPDLKADAARTLPAGETVYLVEITRGAGGTWFRVATAEGANLGWMQAGDAQIVTVEFTGSR